MIKGLSLTQPWATLLAYGPKRVETRGWKTAYRGTVAIHSSMKFPVESRELCYREPFRSALAAIGVTDWEQLPRGYLLGRAELTRIRAIIPPPPAVVHATPPEPADGFMAPPPEPERSFGNYDPGRYGWSIDAARALRVPVRYTGALYLFKVPDELLADELLFPPAA